MTEPRRPRPLSDPPIDDDDAMLLGATPFAQNGVPPPIGSIPYAPTEAPDPSEYDPFDPQNMHVPTDFRAALGVKKALTELACRKPAKE